MVNAVQRGLQAVAQEWDILSRILPCLNLADYRNFRHTNRHILSVTPALPQRLPPIAAAALHNPRRTVSLPSAAASAAPQQQRQQTQTVIRRRTSLPSRTETQAPAVVPQPNPLPTLPLPTNLYPIAAPYQHGHALGPLPTHTPLTIPNLLHQHLGRHSCNDLIGPYPGAQRIPLGPCPNGFPGSTVLAKPCEGATHTPPLETYLVCADCHQHNGRNRSPSLNFDLLHRRARLCKKCSVRLNTWFKAAPRAGTARSSCSCREDVCARWLCYACMNREEERVLAHGLAESYRLLRTHVVRERKSKRKSLVLKRVKGAVPGSLQDRPTRKHHA